MIGRYMIYGIDFVGGTFSNVVDFIEAAHNDKAACLIGFVPLSSAMEASRNKEYKDILNQFDIVTMDGASIVKKVKGGKHWSLERCSGPDAMKEIIRRTAYSKTTHFLYGTNESTLTHLKKFLEDEGATVSGYMAPPYRTIEEWEQIGWKDSAFYDAVKKSGAQYVWVSLGAPKQERFCYAAKNELPGAKMMAVGAAFDYLADVKKRAPSSWQNIGFEWLWRVIHEPYQFRRYCKTALFYLTAKPY